MAFLQSTPDWRASQIFNSLNRTTFPGQSIQSNILSGVPATAVGNGTTDLSGAVTGFGEMNHVTIVVPTGPTTIQFPHNMTWAPTCIFAIQELSEGTTPSAIYGVVWSKVTGAGGTIAINFSAAGTWDVLYC